MKNRHLEYLLIFLILFGIDYIPKMFLEIFKINTLNGRIFSITSFLDINLFKNYNMAFNILSRVRLPFKNIVIYGIFISTMLIAILMIRKTFRLRFKDILPWLLIFSGTFANFIDKFKNGYITDYFILYHQDVFSINFNFADAYIFIGIVDISYDEPRLCYRRVSQGDQPSKKEINPIHKLRSQDQRNKEIAVEKTVEDIKKFLREETIPDSDFKEFEQDMLYYAMLRNLRDDHKTVFGLKHEYLSDEIRTDIVSKLTDDQKNLIRRDFITCHLSDTVGICKQSDLMIDFALLHFPDKIAEIKEKHNEVYIKRQNRINERIAEIEGLINESKMLEAQSDNATKDESSTEITLADHQSEIVVSTLDESSVVDQVAEQTECAVSIIDEEAVQIELDNKPQACIILCDGKISVTEFDQHVDVA